jgi:hypothetical protein
MSSLLFVAVDDVVMTMALTMLLCLVIHDVVCGCLA